MKGNKQLYIFLAKCVAIYIAWNVLYHGWIEPHTDLQMWVTSKTTTVSTWTLNHFYEGTEFTQVDFPKTRAGAQSTSLIRKAGKPLLYVADSCNALTLIVLFMGFILAYPGNWKLKVPFMAVGAVAIFLINVVRVQVLIYNYMHYRSWFDFNHKYTFTIAVYLVVFWFWMLWANKYSKKKVTFGKKLAL